MLYVWERVVDVDRDMIRDVGRLIREGQKLPDILVVEEEAEVRQRRHLDLNHAVRDDVEDVNCDARERQRDNLVGLPGMIRSIVPSLVDCLGDVDDARVEGATGALSPLRPLATGSVLRNELRSTVPKFVVYGVIE